MSGTLPPANKPSLGGRVARAAAKSTLRLGSASFNRMFPAIGRAIGPSKNGAAGAGEEINSSSEDISRNLFRQRALARTILENQLEQNRLLERLLLVYTSGRVATPAVMGGPTPTPPPPATGGMEFELPMPDLPDRRQPPRPQTQQQRPDRNRSKFRRFLTFLKRRNQRLYKAVARRLVVAAAAAVPGPGWIIGLISAIGSVFLTYELYQMYREFSASNSEDEDDNIESDLPSEEEAAAEERALQQQAERELYGDVSEMGETQNLNVAEQAVREAQQAESERRRQAAGLTANLEDPRRQQIMERLAQAQQSLQRRNTPRNRQAVENIRRELDGYNAANPISQADAALIAPPPAAPMGPPRPSREDLLANRQAEVTSSLEAARQAEIQAAGTEQAPRPQSTREQDPIDAAINAAETTSLSAAIDAAINASAQSSEAHAHPEQSEPVAYRIEGDTIIYEFEKIKYEADKIKFEGLSLPSAQTMAQPTSTPSAVSSGAAGVSAAAPAVAAFTPIQEMHQAPTSTPFSRGGAMGGEAPPAPTSTGTGENAPSNQPLNVTGTTGQILATIRKRESNGNYQAQARGSSASGAYQFIDSTWRAMASKFNIGTEYPRAVAAPPAVQDAVAAAYVNDILQKNGGNVAVVPLVWYTGNAQGRMSPAALAVNGGLTPEVYQRSWLAEFARQGGSAPTMVASAPQQAPTTGPALAQASTDRVVADRQQASSSQRMIAEFNQRPPASQQQLQQAQKAPPKSEAPEVPFRSRILEAFQQLARTG
jgi:hypothetical protein